jgi:hypothetical protein
MHSQTYKKLTVRKLVCKMFTTIWILSFTFNILQFFAGCALLSGTDLVSGNLYLVAMATCNKPHPNHHDNLKLCQSP